MNDPTGHERHLRRCFDLAVNRREPSQTPSGGAGSRRGPTEGIGGLLGAI